MSDSRFPKTKSGFLASAHCDRILRIPKVLSIGWAGSLIAVGATILYGELDEFRQSSTPVREVEFADCIADSSGTIVATQVCFFWKGYEKMLERRFPRPKAKGSQKAIETESKAP